MSTVTYVMETRFLNIYSTFLMVPNEWMHPKYDCRICSVSMPNFTNIQALVIINQMSKVWNFTADFQTGFSHSLVFKDTANWSRFNSANNGHIAIICFCILLWILLMWKLSEIFMIFKLFLGQILWRPRNKWKFLTFYLKCAISRKILEVSKIWMTVFW